MKCVFSDRRKIGLFENRLKNCLQKKFCINFHDSKIILLKSFDEHSNSSFLNHHINEVDVNLHRKKPCNMYEM